MVHLPPDDGEPFLAILEKAQASGRPDLVAGNLPRLREIVAAYQERILELARLQHRARIIIERHEPGG